jgi:flagellin-like protein
MDFLFSSDLKWANRSEAWMKKLANDRSAISEIVGALMLILIVVIAASSLAVFVSQQQKILQDNQMIKTQKQGESLLVPSLSIASNNSRITALNLTISSMDQGGSEIDRISINNHVLRNFNVTRTDDKGNIEYIELNSTSKFILVPQQTVHLNASLADFFDRGIELRTDGSIVVKLFTSFSNEFDKVFYAPTAIININTESQWNGTARNYTPFLILDGSGSDQPGDTTIVKWNWTIGNGGDNLTEYGRKVRLDPSGIVGQKVNITLTVENANGMIGAAKMAYYI